MTAGEQRSVIARRLKEQHEYIIALEIERFELRTEKAKFITEGLWTPLTETEKRVIDRISRVEEILESARGVFNNLITALDSPQQQSS